MGLFDDLMKDVAEADREVLKKYPKVAEKIGELDGYVSRWEKWRADEWDSDNKMTKGAVEALKQKDAEIELLKGLQAGDMNWDEMKANVQAELKNFAKENGVVTKSQLETEYLSRFAKPDDIKTVKDAVSNLERGVEITYAKTGHFPLKYMREFGDMKDAPEYTQEMLFKHMTENKIMDYDKGYDSLVSELRAKKQQASLEIERENIRKQVREETMKEMTLKQGAMPLDDRGSSPEMSALQRRIAVKKQVETPEGAPKLTPGNLGEGVGASDAYQAYLRDMAAGTKPPSVQ